MQNQQQIMQTIAELEADLQTLLSTIKSGEAGNLLVEALEDPALIERIEAGLNKIRELNSDRPFESHVD